MAEIGARWWSLRWVGMIGLSFVLASVFASAEQNLILMASSRDEFMETESNYFMDLLHFLWRPGGSNYHHVWPEMKFGWGIVVGSIIGFCGAAFGSVGGVGGGGIFVPMLNLIVGFDAKSSTAISKCMIMGAAGSAVYYNLKLRHPTLDMPIIDYDLALLFQPMLMLGISIGVVFNVIFADWMVTILLITLFLGMSTKAFSKGVEAWKKETVIKKESAQCALVNGFIFPLLSVSGNEEVDSKPLLSAPNNIAVKETKASGDTEVPFLENVYWKELGLLVFVWVAFLALQIAQKHTATCSAAFWVINLLQIPVAVGVSMYEGVSLYKGTRVIASRGDQGTKWKVHQLFLYCSFGVLAGIVGGLLGLGGGFILGPLFLELGIPPQVSSATATFAMTFSSSMSVVEYYLLRRFPVPYALYFVAVAAVASLFGQHVVRRLIIIMGRASLIIFILAFTIFVSAVLLGGVGISNMIWKIKQKEYMGFESVCEYKA